MRHPVLAQPARISGEGADHEYQTISSAGLIGASVPIQFVQARLVDFGQVRS